jgi:putative nucleotidyltransferase with HDIG domain
MENCMESSGLNILVVDDEVEAVNMLSKFLTREGHCVTAAHDGTEAVDICAKAMPDIIVMDIRMPVMDGLEALKRIRKHNEDVIIIMLTAVDDIDTAMNAIKEGADDFIRKPLNLIELKRSIEVNVERKRLIHENRDYQKRLEDRVAEQTQRISKLYYDLKKAYVDVIKALSEAIEAKDPYTRGHCRRVTMYSMRMGKTLGLGKEKMETLEFGTLLHDIGKIGVREDILSKPGKLTGEEFDHVKTHSTIGDNILLEVDFLKEARKIVRYHHERTDGKGYPNGLSDGQLGTLVKIVIIADAYDAMTSERPYRKGMSREKALSILKENRGTQFDGELVNVFIKGKLYLIDEETFAGGQP